MTTDHQYNKHREYRRVAVELVCGVALVLAVAYLTTLIGPT